MFTKTVQMLSSSGVHVQCAGCNVDFFILFWVLFQFSVLIHMEGMHSADVRLVQVFVHLTYLTAR
jgi:hypothetical protein